MSVCVCPLGLGVAGVTLLSPSPLSVPPGPAVPGPTLAMVAMCSILTAVGMAGCYCSVRRHRSQNRLGWGPEAAPGEPRAVAMGPTAPGTPPAPPVPAIV